MTADWRFLLKPKWLLSHLFVGALIAAFIWAGFWQLDRLNQSKEQNATIEARAAEEPMSVAQLSQLPESEVNFRPMADTGRYVDGELIRVANRSLDGVAGDWVVALFETDDGLQVLVNRGFIRRDDVAAPPLDPTTITGWFRNTEVKEGTFGATDTGTGERVPRLDVAVLATRFGLDVAPAWVQLEPGEATISTGTELEVPPQGLALPPLTNGNHLSYAVQWFTFTVLGAGAYVLVLRKLVRQRATEMTSAPTD